jgi:hypothetical protein
MSELSDLRKSLSAMSDEELSEHFRQVRKARRTPLPRAKSTKPKAAPKTGMKSMPKTSELTPDAAAKLLAALGE